MDKSEIARALHSPRKTHAGEKARTKDLTIHQSLNRATHLIADAAGVRLAGLPGVCRACGGAGLGVEFSGWVKPTFTDHDKLKTGTIVCSWCLFCFEDANTALQGRLRKDAPQRFRNYSHFVSNGQWVPLGKGEKRQMAELIYQAEVVVVAVSGQKHLAFRCPSGWWQIEEMTVRPFPDLLRQLAAPVDALYRGGFSKAEIESGRYLPLRIQQFGLPAWNDRESAIRSYRGTLALQLALFLSQRSEDDDT